ncbi:MAG TPA: carbohydrate porin [Thermoanaerobaculia bacterium]|nr:carbohydrate porin [Thermoanaerobaculia bacterium]
MRRTALFKAGLLALVLALTAASVATAQVTGLYYQEVEKDGRIYVFNTPERYQSWQSSGDIGTAITLVGRGANGETIVAENETAMDLYLFKHNLPAYDRPTPKAAKAADFPANKFGIRVYADISSKENKDEATGKKSTDSGEGVDVKRTYFTFTHQFDSVWSAQFQSDIGDIGARRYDVFVKKAYVQAQITPLATFRLGAADTPVIPFVESVYGLRYVEQVITDRLSFGTSAEWGFHILGNSPLWGYQFTVGNGKGYSNPTRTKSVDYEGRISVTPVPGLVLAVGGYSGKLGNDTDATPALHTATRTDALVGFSNSFFKIGGQYFQSDNWRNTTTVATDKADGYSVWGQVNFNPEWSIFGRYDAAKPSKDLKPNLKETYYNAGLQWTINKAFAASLVYKYDEVKGGTFSTGDAGSLGSVNAASKGKFQEIGIYTVYNF